MEKKVLYITIIGAALAALSCNKEIGNPEDTLVQGGNEVSGETVSFTLSVPESDTGTRTTLGDKDGSAYPVLWSADDVITLNGTAATSFTPESGNASAKATFKLANLSAPYNFLYGGVSGQSAQVTFPATQNYVAGGFDPAALPMYASLASRSDNVTFSHLAALLKFSITGSKKIDSVSLAAADENQSLSGNFTIGTTSGLLNGSLTPVATGAGLIYSFGGHIQLSTTPFEFFIAIPAGTYEGGITLTIVDNDSGSMAVKVLDTDATKTISAGKVREFNAIEYVPEKEKNLIQIYDATTLNKFRTRVANGETTLNARVTCNAASFSASSIASAWVPIEDYKGIFEGNGKGITGLTKPLFGTLKGVVKNLTLNSTINATAADDRNWGMFAKQIIPSSEVDDIAGLQNCTAQGTLTYTPSSALSSDCQIGGLVGNNKGGSISGCTNEATVTMGDNGQTNASQVSLGGVLGRTQKGGDLSSQGDISNCSNSGTVICNAQLSENLYVGGVIGYQVEKKESMSGCVNHGLVKVGTTFSTTKALQLGGVAGLAKGILENCTNASDGTVTSENGSSAGTYFCQGGVVGRLNREADSYSGLSNAGTLNVGGIGTGNASGNGIYAGGVVGRCNEGATITEFTNSGSINCSSVNTSYHTYIGGVVAANSSSCILLENCHSTAGTISYNGSNPAGNLYIGGIVGYSSKPISSCTSAMTINVGGEFEGTGGKYYSVGGIVGSMSDPEPITSCLNTGSITYSQEISNSAYSFLGGVAGRAMGNIIDSSNGGTVTWSGMNSSQNPFIGGLVGDTANDAAITISGKYSSASATNFGKVEINTSTQTNKYFYVGGVAGRLRCAVSSATNAGQINVPQLTCTSLYAGGIAGSGTTGNASITSCQNLADGDFNISGLTSNQQSYIGGLAGHMENSACSISGTNSGDIVLTSGSKAARSLFVGGIAGRCHCPISDCTNNGAVSNAAQMTGGSDYYMQIGGIVGYNNNDSPISNCINNGNVTNTANSGSYLFVGGITSESDGAISDCTNTGAVSNSGNAGAGKWISIGGIVGSNSDAITSSHNEGAVSNSGVPDEDINIGGVAGLNSGQTLTSCYNTGSVVNSGDSKTGYNVSVGGLVGWSSANSVYVTCYNEGDVENSGNGSNTSATDPGARVAGLIASASGANTISGDADNYNYNNGEVYEHSASARAAVGGVCAWANNASTSLDYARNLSGGVIWVEDGEYTNVYVGGVLGVETAAASFNYTKNAGKIGIRNITISKAAYIGGVHGGFTANGAQTITGCENTGVIDCPDSGGKSENMKSTSSASVVTYIGGISSGAGNDAARTGKTFTNCINRAAITMYNQCWTRLGGVVGYANQNPSGCENHGKIVYYRKAGGYNSSSGAVGGVVGYINIATVSNLTNTGGVQSTGSSPNCYTGGIVGSGGKNMNTMTNCNVGKSGINIVGSGNAAQVAGLFASSESGSKAWTFTGCKVMSGTKCRGTVVTDANMETYVIGRGAVPSSITDPPVVVSSF